MKAIQLYYPPEWAHCYGCGYLNAHGLHIQTYWDPEKGESETRFTPRPYHTAIPGFAPRGFRTCRRSATSTAATLAWRVASDLAATIAAARRISFSGTFVSLLSTRITPWAPVPARICIQMSCGRATRVRR